MRFLLAAFIILSVLVGGVGYYEVTKFLKTPPSPAAQEVIYEVLPGKNFSQISQDLFSKGLVTDSVYFRIYGRMTGKGSKIKIGEYALKTNMIPSEVLAILVSGKSIEHSFTVTEGLSVYEIAELFEKQGHGKKSDFLKLVFDTEFVKSLLGENQISLEGYLFPETYKLTKYTNAKSLITNMVKRFFVVWSDVAPKSLPDGWTRHQVVTLASIVEKETGAPEERPLISSVFHNRLQKKMRLQTDPTVIYGKAEKSGKIEINITRDDLKEPTRYNTYVINGLPPGPIANPGKEALTAALNPEKSDYLFFVSQNNGTHVFSEDYGGHKKAVKKFQLDSKARKGHSWRELNKSKDSK